MSGSWSPGVSSVASRGVRDVGINELVDRAGVTKATLYRHFPPKTTWSSPSWSYASSAGPGAGSRPRPDAAAPLPRSSCWRSSICSTSGFTARILRPARSSTCCPELGAAHPAGRASIEHLENIRSVVRQLAEEASLSDPDSFARSWHILMKGSIVSAAEGDPNAAQRAKAMARRLIEDHSHPAPAIAGLA